MALGWQQAKKWALQSYDCQELTLVNNGPQVGYIGYSQNLQIRAHQPTSWLQPCETLRRGPVQTYCTSDLYNSELVNGCCFRSLSLFICYSSNERLIQIPTLRSFSFRIMWIPGSKTQLSLLHCLLQLDPLLRRSWFHQFRRCSSKSGSDKGLGVEGS